MSNLQLDCIEDQLSAFASAGLQECDYSHMFLSVQVYAKLCCTLQICSLIAHRITVPVQHLPWVLEQPLQRMQGRSIAGR